MGCCLFWLAYYFGFACILLVLLFVCVYCLFIWCCDCLVWVLDNLFVFILLRLLLVVCLIVSLLLVVRAAVIW